MNESLKFSQFGADNGQLVIYFHGSPGAPEECAIFDSCGKEHGLTFISFDRFSIHASVTDAVYYQLLAKEILKKSAGKKSRYRRLFHRCIHCTANEPLHGW